MTTLLPYGRHPCFTSVGRWLVVDTEKRNMSQKNGHDAGDAAAPEDLIVTPEDFTRLARRTRNRQPLGGELGAKANAAMGLTGEAGEVAETMKKELFHGHDTSRDEIEEELGDLLWYASWIADLYGLSLTECMQRNIRKLRTRYPAGFSSEHSRNRVE